MLLFHLTIAPASAQQDPAVGIWAWGGGRNTVTLTPDGNALESGRSGKWFCRDAAARTYVITWKRQPHVDTFHLNEALTRMDGSNQFGKTFFVTRVGEPPARAEVENAEDKDGNRKWTQAFTGAVIEGRIVDKATDGSWARLARKETGKSVELKAETLVEEDRQYIKYWVRPGEYITARPREFGVGWKKVTVELAAGPEPMTVSITGDLPRPAPQIAGVPRPPITRVLAKGETLQLDFACGNDYVVEGRSGGKVVDREEDMAKTKLSR